jgi:ABC-2 type transport system permease protein
MVVRELRLLLCSSTGAAMTAVWALCVGALFLVDLTAFEQAEQRAMALNDPALLAMLDVNDLLFASVLGNVVVLFLFFAPLLAMRLFADDRSTRDWLLHASSPAILALGRLGAGTLVAVALVGSTLGLAWLLAFLGRPADVGAVVDGAAVVDIAQAVCATVTVAACAVCFVAVACAVAAIVDVPLAAGALSFLVLIVWWLLPSGSSLVGPQGAAWLSWASPSSHLERGLRGVVDGGDIVWFGGVVAAATVAVWAGLGRGRR